MAQKTYKFLSHQDMVDIHNTSRKVIRALGGIEAVAADTGICKSTIGNIHNRFNDATPSLDFILNAERDLEEPLFTKMLARKQGHVLIPVISSINDMEAANLLASLGKETSEAFGSIGAAIADRKITLNEAMACRDEVLDMVAEGNKLVQYFDRIIETETLKESR